MIEHHRDLLVGLFFPISTLEETPKTYGKFFNSLESDALHETNDAPVSFSLPLTTPHYPYQSLPQQGSKEIDLIPFHNKLIKKHGEVLEKKDSCGTAIDLLMKIDEENKGKKDFPICSHIIDLRHMMLTWRIARMTGRFDARYKNVDMKYCGHMGFNQYSMTNILGIINKMYGDDVEQ
jgi:hypothetical protein